LNLLEAQALIDGTCHPVHLRVAEQAGALWLDLSNPAWEAVSITAGAWTVSPDPPVRFRRSRGMLALPTPILGGSLDDLRRFVNVADDADWLLLLTWLLQTLRPGVPAPILALMGEQGAAKSTTMRVLRRVVDPNAAPLRAQPRNEEDLMIAAT